MKLLSRFRHHWYDAPITHGGRAKWQCRQCACGKHQCYTLVDAGTRKIWLSLKGAGDE